MRINDDLSVSFNSEGKRALFWRDKPFAVITDENIFECVDDFKCSFSSDYKKEIEKIIDDLKMLSSELSDLESYADNAIYDLERIKNGR